MSVRRSGMGVRRSGTAVRYPGIGVRYPGTGVRIESESVSELVRNTHSREESACAWRPRTPSSSVFPLSFTAADRGSGPTWVRVVPGDPGRPRVILTAAVQLFVAMARPNGGVLPRPASVWRADSTGVTERPLLSVPQGLQPLSQNRCGGSISVLVDRMTSVSLPSGFAPLLLPAARSSPLPYRATMRMPLRPGSARRVPLSNSPIAGPCRQAQPQMTRVL